MNKVSNKNLKRALCLRSAEQYADAITYLDLACKDGDSIAYALMGVALLYGGWGLQRNVSAGHCYLQLSIDNGYKAAMYYQNYAYIDCDIICRIIKNRDIFLLSEQSKYDVAVVPQAFSNFLSGDKKYDFDFTHLIQLNDAYVNYCFSQNLQFTQQKMALLKRSADQNFEQSCRKISSQYYAFDLFDLAAPYIIKRDMKRVKQMAQVDPENQVHAVACPARMRELYLYGEYFCQFPDIERASMAVRVYVNTKAAVSSALVTWWLVANKMRLYADLRKLISWWVLKRKKDPSVWEINVT